MIQVFPFLVACSLLCFAALVNVHNPDFWIGQCKMRQAPCWTPLHGFKKVQLQAKGHGVDKAEFTEDYKDQGEGHETTMSLVKKEQD